MKLKSGDKVKLLNGKDKGKIGKILQIIPERKKASVEGLNLMIKHMRPKKQGEKGQKIEFPAAIDISNLMLVCPKCNKSVKVNYKQIKKEGKRPTKVRICNKCKELID